MKEKQANGPTPQDQEDAQVQEPVHPKALDLMVAELTDVGRARPRNEDYVKHHVPLEPEQLARKGSIYLVADGMGGHQAGDVASRGAVEKAIEHYYEDSSDEIGKSLIRAFQIANEQIHAQAEADPSKSGMGTTLVAAVILGRKVYVANVGDSRAYLINRQKMTQITHDHSWVEEQVRVGLLTPEQALRHPQRNLVTRALGSRPSVEVDLFEGEIDAGDTLLLCSDGLTGRVKDREIERIVRDSHPQQAAKELVDLANERGGKDNITVLIISAREELETVRAVPIAPVGGKPIHRSRAAVAIVIALAILALTVGGLLAVHSLTGDKPTETPTASPPVTTVTVMPEPSAPPTGETIPDSSGSPLSPGSDRVQAPATPPPGSENIPTGAKVTEPSIPGRN